MFDILYTIIAESIAISIAIHINQLKYIRILCILNIFLIATHGHIPIDIIYIHTKIATVYFSAFYCLTNIVAVLYGREETRRQLHMLLFAGFCFILLSNAVISIGNSPIEEQRILIQIRIVVAAFTGYFVSQIYFLRLLLFFNPLTQVAMVSIVGVITAQTIDSIFFFPLAFPGQSIMDTSSIVISGVIVKSLLTLVFFPFVLFAVKRARKLYDIAEPPIITSAQE